MLDCILLKIDWISFGTLIVALFTLGATYRTINEMKTQREQSNMPDIFLSSETRFYLYRAVSNDNIQYQYWHQALVKEDKDVEGLKYHLSCGINCFNIGLGCAKHINYKYNFDTDSIKTFIENFGKVKINKLDVQSENVSFDAELSGYKMGGGGGKIDLDFTQDFLLEKANTPSIVNLPRIYLNLFNTFVLSVLDSPLGPHRDKFPPLKLIVRYYDIANKLYEKKFIISISLDSLAINTNLCPSHVSGLIKVNEIRSNLS